jgi:hypothetical protein
MTESTENKQEQTGAKHGYSCDCGCMGAGPVMAKLFKRFMPPKEVGEHFRQSRIEFLKGIRELVDHHISAMSDTAHKGTRINVE